MRAESWPIQPVQAFQASEWTFSIQGLPDPVTADQHVGEGRCLLMMESRGLMGRIDLFKADIH